VLIPQRPFWSPDSKSIAYFTIDGLYRVKVSGGAPTPIFKRNLTSVMSGSWSEDGTIVFFEPGKGLLEIPASGGEPKQLLDGPVGFPQMLPSGVFLYWQGGDAPGIYAATRKNPKNGQRLVSPTDGPGVYASGYLLWKSGTALVAQPFDPVTLKLSGEPQQLLESIAVGDLGEPMWTVSTTGRAIYDAEGNDRQLAWYPRNGPSLGSIDQPRRYQGFRLFDNGRRIIIQANAPSDRGVWVIDEGGRSTHPIAGATVNPIPSPDGKSFVSSLPGAGLYRADISGENRLRFKTVDTNFQFATDWSGDVLLFTPQMGETKNDIYSLKMSPNGTPAPGATPVPYLNGPAMEHFARFAPGQKERWLAYQSDESGREEVYIQSFPTKGEKVAVSQQGGSFPVWGPDGHELFYTSPDNKVMVVSVTFNGSSASASPPRVVFTLPPNITYLPSSPFETIDGQKFLVLSGVAPPTRPLQMISNWPALLRH
jgi:Tol biopolymer transport system component